MKYYLSAKILAFLDEQGNHLSPIKAFFNPRKVDLISIETEREFCTRIAAKNMKRENFKYYIGDESGSYKIDGFAKPRKWLDGGLQLKVKYHEKDSSLSFGVYCQRDLWKAIKALDDENAKVYIANESFSEFVGPIVKIQRLPFGYIRVEDCQDVIYYLRIR